MTGEPAEHLHIGLPSGVAQFHGVAVGQFPQLLWTLLGPGHFRSTHQYWNDRNTAPQRRGPAEGLGTMLRQAENAEPALDRSVNLPSSRKLKISDVLQSHS